ncbi:MAG: TolC family protein [Calditrichaeota bacterium]|nr:TolC family protein [Calditrichota bacterium]
MKKFQIYISFLLVFSFVITMQGMAQVWTLQKVKNTAFQVNPRLQSLQNIVKAKQGALQQAAAFPNPEIGGITGNRSKMLSFGQQLEYPGKRNLRIKRAEQELQITRLNLQQERLNISAQAAALFFEVLWAQKNLTLVKENLTVTKNFLQAAQLKFQRGFGSKLDVIKGQVEVLRARRLLLTAKKELLNKRTQLKLLLKLSLKDTLTVKGTMDQSLFEPRGGLDSLLTIAYERSPELTIQQHKLLLSQLQLQAVQLSTKPDFNLDLAGGVEDKESKIELELRMPLAIWDRKKGAKSEALFIKKSAEYDSENVRLQITQQVTAAFQSYENAHQSVKLFQDSILKDAESAAQMAQRAFETSSFRFLDLIDAQRTYLSTVSEYEQVLLESRLAEIELRRSIGFD